MKQVIVMRTDLNMRKGKMVAQGAHASLGAVLPYLGIPYRQMFPDEARHYLEQHTKVHEWLADRFTKVCVGVDSEMELVELEMKAEANGLITCLITDAGKTEFHGEPTITCCAVGPDTDENLEPVTGHLRLL